MRLKATLILFVLLVVGQTAWAADTLYTEKAAMEIYASQPERALQIIDSAVILGNMDPLRSDLLRAIIFSRTNEEMNYDSAILIGEQLMRNDSVLANTNLQEEVLELLLNACRLRKDNEAALYWATELSDLYRNLGKDTEALRTDAEIGYLLIRIGQKEEGLAKIDNAIGQLDGQRKFNELDASIIALKRKAEICSEKGLYGDVIPTAQHILDLLDDYEQHPDEYHDGCIREPNEDRPGYIDFYRGKAYAYLADANASLVPPNKERARHYIALYEQTVAGQSLTGRNMIAYTLGKLGAYDKMLDIYDEVEQLLGADTLNDNYALILKSRAEVAEAMGYYADASGYWRRYANLSELLNERLLQGRAHLYAARFHAQNQQREIERQREAIRRAVMTRTVIGFTGLLILLFAIYSVVQWFKTKRHNRFLAQQITEAVEYKAKYRELVENEERSTSQTPHSTSQVPLSTLSDAELFAYLRDLIDSEKLYLNPYFERQILIDRTGLSKDRIGAAFAQGSDHERLTTLVRELRLDYAVRLMNEHPEFTVEQVCQASGFANADTFTRNFKAKFGMTPTAYRATLG